MMNSTKSDFMSIAQHNYEMAQKQHEIEDIKRQKEKKEKEEADAINRAFKGIMILLLAVISICVMNFFFPEIGI